MSEKSFVLNLLHILGSSFIDFAQFRDSFSQFEILHHDKPENFHNIRDLDYEQNLQLQHNF